MNAYRVQLDAYSGPLDLLLYLIKREEVDVYDIPIARITEQYVEYVELLKQLDPNAAGEFLVLAATLMEIKSRTLLPRPPEADEEEDFDDPRLELVRQLLEYKKFKDIAHSLGHAASEQLLRHPRQPADLPSEPTEIDLEEAQVWDLLAAFNRLMTQIGRGQVTHDVVYDDTPVSLHAADVVDWLERAGGSMTFDEIFEGRTKAEMIGLFLALLELIRQRRINAEQGASCGPIIIHLLDSTPITDTVPEEDNADTVTSYDEPADATEDEELEQFGDMDVKTDLDPEVFDPSPNAPASSATREDHETQ